MPDEINKIIKAATRGGEVLLKYFQKDLKIKVKTIPADFFTKADLESEKIIIKTLTSYFPKYNILGEETGLIDKKSEYTFIVDPLDGSNNYILGIPYFAVSIGLMKNNNIISGVIYSPITNDVFHAQINKGAFKNNKKITVNKVNEIEKTTISFLKNYNHSKEYYYKLIKNINELNVKRLTEMWCVTLDYCLLASGKIEIIINLDMELHDFAAGKIIAQEAGALITDFQGKKEKNDKNSIFLASNGTSIHKKIIEIL